MKVVPEDVLTAPLEGLTRISQSTAVILHVILVPAIIITSLRSQVGASGVQFLSLPHVLLSLPIRMYPSLHV